MACLELWLFLPQATPLRKLKGWEVLLQTAGYLANLVQQAVNLSSQSAHFNTRDDSTLQLDVAAKALLCEQYFESYMNLIKVTSKASSMKGVSDKSILTNLTQMSQHVVQFAEACHREKVIVASACVLSIALGKMQQATHELKQVAGGAADGAVWDSTYVAPEDDNGKGILVFFKETLDSANLQQISNLRNVAHKAAM